jgi:outer membrane protein TolC
MKVKTTNLALLALALAVPHTAFAQALPDLPDYRVGEALPPIEEGDEVVELSLEDAISIALEANLSLQSARLDPTIQQFSLRQARLAFNPTFSTNVGFNNAQRPAVSQLDGGQTLVDERLTVNTSLQQTIPWYGARLSMNFNNSRNETNNQFATFNPSYSSNVNLSLTQPLLAGLMIDNQRAQVQTQQIQTDITGLQLEQQTAIIENQVRQRYWGLRAAIEQIEIQRRAVQQQLDLLEQNRVRLQAGQGTEFQVIQSEAQVASAEQSLLNAQIQWQNQELLFKQVLSSGADDGILDVTIVPTTVPTVIEEEVDLDAAVERALGTRLDLRQQRRQIDVAEVNLEVTETNALPQLNLTASYSLAGVGGDLFQRDALGGEPVLVDAGGYLDGLRQIADFDTPTWNIGLNGSIPIGTNPNRLAAERAELQLRQQNLSLRTQELSVVTQVTAAGLAVRNTFLQYEAAQRNSEASALSYQAEQARYEVGVSTNFELLQAQNQLTTARLQELQALLNHINAIADFEQVQVVGN